MEISQLKEIKTQLSGILSKQWTMVCMGNELRADDEVGLYIGKTLAEKSHTEQIILAHNVPANFLSKIVSQEPESLLFVDAIDLRQYESDIRAGTIALFDPSVTTNTGATTTHYQEMDDLLGFIKRELGYEPLTRILGIQIATTELMAPMTPEVKVKADQLIELINDLLS